MSEDELMDLKPRRVGTPSISSEEHRSAQYSGSQGPRKEAQNTKAKDLGHMAVKDLLERTKALEGRVAKLEWGKMYAMEPQPAREAGSSAGLFSGVSGMFRAGTADPPQTQIRQNIFQPNTQEYKSKIQVLEKEKEYLLQKLEKRDQSLAQYKQEFGRALKNAQALESRNTFKVADNEICKEWADLRYLVRDFVRQNLVRVVAPGATTPEMAAIFQDIVSDPRTFLENPYLAQSLFEAWIWRCLHASVFSEDSQVWASDLGKSFFTGVYSHASSSQHLF